jgi:hypothetical protein
VSGPDIVASADPDREERRHAQVFGVSSVERPASSCAPQVNGYRFGQGEFILATA